jgi:hypothetical protein
MKTTFACALALSLAVGPGAASAKSLKELLQEKLKGKSTLEKDAEQKRAGGTEADKLKDAKSGDMFEMMKKKRESMPKEKHSLDKLIDRAEEWGKGVYKKITEKPKEEKEETALDKWREQQKGKGPSVLELMKAKSKGSGKVEADKPKEKSLEEMLRDKMKK